MLKSALIGHDRWSLHVLRSALGGGVGRPAMRARAHSRARQRDGTPDDVPARRAACAAVFRHVGRVPVQLTGPAYARRGRTSCDDRQEDELKPTSPRLVLPRLPPRASSCSARCRPAQRSSSNLQSCLSKSPKR